MAATRETRRALPAVSALSSPFLGDIVGRLDNYGGISSVPVALFSRDFATDLALGTGLTFSRASASWLWTDAGVLASVANDVARFDHDPITNTSLGLLIEADRVNAATYSAEFDQAIWAKAASSVTANATTAPDGLSTADKLVEDTSTAGHSLAQINLGTGGMTSTMSVFAKAAGRSHLIMRSIITSGGGATNWCGFDLSNGTVGTAVNENGASGSVGRIDDVGGGWYRCAMTGTLPAGASQSNVIYPGVNSTDPVTTGRVYTGDGTSGLYLWGAQVERNAPSASSYLQTTTPAQTRAAEVCTQTGTNFSDWYNAAGSSVLCEFIANAVGTSVLWQMDNGTATERIALKTVDGVCTLEIIDGTLQTTLALGTLTHGAPYKIAAGWQLDDVAASVNGDTEVTDNSATMPTPTALRIGYSLEASYANTPIAKISGYDSRLSNAQLRTISA